MEIGLLIEDIGVQHNSRRRNVPPQDAEFGRCSVHTIDGTILRCVPENANGGSTRNGKGEHFGKGKAWCSRSLVAQRYRMEAVLLPWDEMLRST
ncbi:Os06g0243900 [Oryza sativa Japonica Group]|uniref:Os06g0243900 protein n=2 Tax=Oryza sativa subsp. japonica TaxID=39947 RepID=Q0DD87_ORYSJ|nr:hypothetical protein EE612_033046 [Oryza sativa]BAF19186.1 Os06g0243900 [Oryza sativa Japonica Group]BAS97014.1 Os06g0243900 [Oryza sativa Japonica Group]|eukprot:NP_001057272.1 Os06g0243900 [Oryza sativa Japonica Group]